jgi:hypothetical protein
MRQWVWACCGVALLFSGASFAAAETLIPNTSTWKYLHPTDGKDPATNDEDFHKTFATADFDDAAWKSGKDAAGPHGGFGYGEEEFEGVDLGQPDDLGDRKSAYFRLKFKTTKDVENLVLKCQFDDGIIVYLDGKEVARKNMPAGEEDKYDLFAEETVGGEVETSVQEIAIKAKLAAGDHILAISLHNRDRGSSDLRLAEVSLETAEK